ncbi:hypothetical protein PG987_009811 [Apiospora arundinis]
MGGIKKLVSLLIVSVAGTGLAWPVNTTIPQSPTSIPTTTVLPGSTSGTVPHFKDEDNKELITGILHTMRGRKKAKKCNDIDNEGVFVNKTEALLGGWNTTTGIPNESSQTEKQILERLVVY